LARQLSTLGLAGCAVMVSGLGTLLGAAPAAADVKLEVINSTYELHGLSREAIHDDMHRVGKKDGDGIIEGEVNDDLAWKLKLAETNGSCRVTSDEITLKLSVTLPVWVDEARAGPEVRAVWNTYYRDLKAHEDGHKAIAVDAAERINKITHEATAAGPCKALERSLNSTARQIYDAAEEAQEQHDANAELFAFE
jgi:predicted secreted Zn-dependent protease